MKVDGEERGVAIVGIGAILPDAPDVATFWENVRTGHSSIGDVPPARWDPELYYDADPAAPDKTYSKIGGWVRQWTWDPRAWKLPIPPKVADAMDDAQKWGVACTRAVLDDHAARGGLPFDTERTAVIVGNAMAGELHYRTALRIYLPEYAEALAKAPSFIALPEETRQALLQDMHDEVAVRFPRINEDTMPGELGNILAGRIANLFNFRGPSCIVDAACGSAMAAVDVAVRGLISRDFDAAITGGIDRNMGASSFVKFCKIGALSATGTRPYAEGADGFVMGEGAALFLLKRLVDAERDGDRIYAVIRGIAGSSDGRGKGITAPNPIGQRLAVERAWRNAGLDPATATLVEGHGTSTRVGDVVEVESLTAGFDVSQMAPGSIALGSVKSNIGHLKAAAGGAGLLKTVLALADGVLPPSINFHAPNPNIDFEHSPFRVNTELREWERPAGGVRRAGVSAFGFGGTNWHAVLEEYVPGASRGGRSAATTAATVTAADRTPAATEPPVESAPAADTAVDRTPAAADTGGSLGAVAERSPLRGALVVGGATAGEISERLSAIEREANGGRLPSPATPRREDLAAPERIAIDYADGAELIAKIKLALSALESDAPATWKALKGRGVFRGSGPAPKVAFLYPGQGSQYANMARGLAQIDPLVAGTFEEADEIMAPLLGRPLTSFLFVDPDDKAALAEAEVSLMQTAITQPAVLAVDAAMTKLLAAYGIEPDMVMGHSLGEYGALVAAGGLSFPGALEAVSARGREMTSLDIEDNGKMAAVLGPLVEIERILAGIDGNVVIANVNSTSQAVIGGASDAVDRAVAAVTEAGMDAIPLPVSHAFHTSIVAPASDPLRRALDRLDLHAPSLPIVANVSGEFYPTDGDVKEQMLDILAAQVASPVQFVKGLHTLYEAGARVFVEVGPKKALQGFVDDVLAGEEDVVSLFTNHPKVGDVASFNQALCGLYAAGLGAPAGEAALELAPEQAAVVAAAIAEPVETVDPEAEAVEPDVEVAEQTQAVVRFAAEEHPKRRPVVITGAGLGLPGTERVFDDSNFGRILGGEQLIHEIPGPIRTAMLGKHITRLVKRENGDPSFETIDDESEVIKLAGRAGALDLAAEFGVAAERIPALDRSTKLAIGAGIDALRDAGIPMVLHYKTTSKNTQLPLRWGLPADLADSTGVIFASAFPGIDSFAQELNGYHRDKALRERLADLRAVRAGVPSDDTVTAFELDRRIADLEAQLEAEGYGFDRRFLFRVLSMGHSQFAEIVGARGPNTQVNAACASTTQAVALAEDWISEGRCRRVVVIAADDATSDTMMEWIGAGFLASGAAATDDVVEDAATPFDRRRHGMIVGMGAAALVVESAEAAEERGIRPIVEVLAAVHGNSAFHGTRLDVRHISGVMESLVSEAERRWGVRREEMAPELVFVSHETYTPARGGSAAAEVEALRLVFGPQADDVVVANTKGFTGHPMGVGIEDVLAVKILESGIVPPVPNYREVDPDLGTLNLSKGGSYPVRYALRLAAGFGSQIAMSLVRWVPTPDGARTRPSEFGYAGRVANETAWKSWLARVSGVDSPELEVVQRRLRVRDEAEAARRVPAATAPETALEPVTAPAARGVAVAEPAPILEPESTAVVEADLAPRAVETAPVAAPTPVTEPAEVPIPTASTLDEDEVRLIVMDLVAQATGYPTDMLDPELDLEADLGVDTVKQAEIFAAIRGRYDIPRDESLKLRDFPTLNHVVGFVMDRAPGAQATVEASAVSSAAPLVAELEPAAAPAVIAPEPTPTASTLDEDEVRLIVMDLVAQATGYPTDMLDPELDLEADLGVDTVKQAEIFAAIRGRYDIPRDESLKLRDFPTLNHVVGFVMDRAPGAQATVEASAVSSAAPLVAELEPAAAPAVIAPEPTPTASTLDEDEVRLIVMDLVAQATGYPTDMLDPELDLEADLGVDTVKQAEIFAAIRGRYDIPRDESLKLRDFPTLNHVVGFVMDRAPGDGSTAATVLEVEHVEPVEPVVAEAVLVVEPTEVAPVAPPAATATTLDEDEVRGVVMELVANATGYPTDMLDPELDLEADLGVDTVKQAEIFAAIRGRYDIPRDESLKLRDFPTLNHVVGFVMDRAPGDGSTAATVLEVEHVEPVEPVVAEAVLVVEPTEVAPVAPPAATASTLDEDEVRLIVMDLVAQATGYPTDMLDPELDLEADLGVDTVKQAEIFAAIRGRYDIPRDESLKLRDFPTLNHVVGFVMDRAPGAQATVEASAVSSAAPLVAELEPAAAPAVIAPEPTPTASTLDEDEVRLIVMDLVAQATGYPTDMLDPELDLEADLGVDTVKQAEIFAAIRGRYDIPRDESLKLRDFPTLNHVVGFVMDRAPGAQATVEASAVSSAAPLVAELEPAAAPAVIAPEPTPTASTLDEDEVRLIVMDLVAQATGYPTDMLDPELDLEADLGVDTVKQAEIFAAIRGRYDIPRDESLKLRDFPTLNHVVGFVMDRAPRGGATVAEPATATAEPAATTVERPIQVSPHLREGIEAANGVPRRVAVPVLRPALDRTVPTGVEIANGSRIAVMADGGGVAKELAARLEERGADVFVIAEHLAAEELEATLTEWLTQGPATGLYWLPALDRDDVAERFEPDAWREALRVRVKLLAVSARTIYDSLGEPGSFLVAGTRLGGYLGADDDGALSSLGGAVVGFTKALRREREHSTVKVVDVEGDASAAQVAEALIAETLRDPGSVEVGHAGDLRWAVGLQERPLADADAADGLALGPGSVFVVTGAAGSIVSEIVSDLAKATGGSFHLLDLADEPAPDDPDLIAFDEGREVAKKALMEKARAAGEKPTPVLIERWLGALERAHASLSAMRAVVAAGGAATYHRVDLTDPVAVGEAVAKITAQHDRVDVVLHAAGLEISRFLPDKEQREFDLVFDVKSNGWANLLHALDGVPIGAAVTFCSVAGRFGNGGQTDYSAANGLLAAAISNLRRTRPETRGIAIDWTAWAGIGMATRGSIPKMMELAGIDMLPPEVGVPYIRRELVGSGFRGELVVGGRLGIMHEEWAERGGIDPSAFDRATGGPVTGTVHSMGIYEGLRVDVELDPGSQPFLDDHRIDGTPVMPGVMGIETFAEVARLALPGWHVVAVEDVAFHAPLKYYRDEARTVTVEAVFHPRGAQVVADCRLIGYRDLPGREEPLATVHFSGRVVLAAEPAAPERADVPEPTGGAAPKEAIYQVYFHGPAYRVLDRAWPENPAIGLFREGLPPNHEPSEEPLVASPRLIELCFQTAGMWEICGLEKFGLPAEVARVRLVGDPDDAEMPVLAVVRPVGDAFDAEVVDAMGNVLVALEGYRTVELPGALDPAAIATLRSGLV